MLESIESGLADSAYRPFVVEYGRPAGLVRVADTAPAESSSEREERSSRQPRVKKTSLPQPVSYGADASVHLEEGFSLFELYA